MVEASQQFNFQQEAAEIQEDMVTSMTVVVDPESSSRATVTLVTLEETKYVLDWTIQNGLQVTSIDDQPVSDADMQAGGSYEDLNQFLQGKSARYQQKFNEKLMEKLMGIQQDRQQL